MAICKCGPILRNTELLRRVAEELHHCKSDPDCFSSGLDVFPFQPMWSRPLDLDKPVLASRSVSQSVTARSKGSSKKSVELRFEDRLDDEYDTAAAFWNGKYPAGTFIYRDDAFSPARDTEMRFTSSLSSTGISYDDIAYGFTAEEV